MDRIMFINNTLEVLFNEENYMKLNFENFATPVSISQITDHKKEQIQVNDWIVDDGSHFPEITLRYQSTLSNEKQDSVNLKNNPLSSNESTCNNHHSTLSENQTNNKTSKLNSNDFPNFEKIIISTTDQQLCVERNELGSKTEIEKYVLNQLETNFVIDFDDKNKAKENNFQNIFQIYMKIIKNHKVNQFSINQMMDEKIQTNVDYNNLKSLETEIFSFLNECNNSQGISIGSVCESEIGLLENIELCVRSLKYLKNQVKKLQNDLEYEEHRKFEMSDKFEKIIIELETACDSEIEQMKFTNNLLKQEINSLQTLREEQDNSLNLLRSQIFDLQLQSTKTDKICEKETSNYVLIKTNDKSCSWIDDFNDALRQTISEKEDQITELMKKYNESYNEIKIFELKNESQTSEIQELKQELELASYELKSKENFIKDNLDVINDFEVVCTEKDNRINSLEKELVEINCQLEQYITAVCSMQARLEASKPNLDFMLNKIDNRSSSLQLLNLIDQLEKDYSEELEQSEMSKSKLEIKLNKAVQFIHKLKKQLKQSHIYILKLNEEMKTLKSVDSSQKVNFEINVNENDNKCTISSTDFSTQSDFENEAKVLKEENLNFKGIIENLNVNNFLLWKELENVRNTDRNVRGSSLPPSTSSTVGNGKYFQAESERSLSPVSQISSNSFDGNTVNLNQVKDLQRKIHRTTQQLNQMRVERNRIHQEYTRIRQLKEEGDKKISDLLRHIDINVDQDNIIYEKDQLIEMNNKYSVKIVELQAEIDMTTVRNSILETKCKKMEWKLNNQRRKYDQLILKLDEKDQEIDRYSDDLRRTNSAFEKEKLDWFREKKELKLINKNKDEKICDFRKKLSKNKTISGKNEKKELVDDNGENDYLLEIEQLRKQINQQKLEFKQCLSGHREEMMKKKGQLEELIDDNRQLKRKLSFLHSDYKINPSEKYSCKKTNSMMQVIDEVMDTSSLSGFQNNSDSCTMLAKVVLEKESLMQLLNEKVKELNDEKEISQEYQQEIIRFNSFAENKDDLENEVNKRFKTHLMKSKADSTIPISENKTKLKYVDKEVLTDHNQDFGIFSYDKLRYISDNKLNSLNQEVQTDDDKDNNLDISIFNEFHRVFDNKLNKEIQTDTKVIYFDTDISTNDGSNYPIKEYKNQFVQYYDMKMDQGNQTSPICTSCVHIITSDDSLDESKQLTIQCKSNPVVEYKYDLKEKFNQYSQTTNDLQKSIIKKYRQCQLLKLDIQKITENEFEPYLSFNHVETQTELYNELEFLSTTYQVQSISPSISNQTESDQMICKLKDEISTKDLLLDNYHHKMSLDMNRIHQLENELDDAINEIKIISSSNLNYQEKIDQLESDCIKANKSYSQEIDKLNFEIKNFEFSKVKNQNIISTLNDPDQLNESHILEGWDMEWEYEKTSTDYESKHVYLDQLDKEKKLSFADKSNINLSFFSKLDLILNLQPDNEICQEIKKIILSYSSQNDSNCNYFSKEHFDNSNIMNLVALLREEITQLKQLINEKNREIGNLQCVRNQLQTELLESGQQIKESNMEFLNLKESIQAVQVERDILIIKNEELNKRLKKLVNFNRMISVDLHQLQDFSPHLSNEPIIFNNEISDQDVTDITQSLEHELHTLLERTYGHDMKSENSINQIEKLINGLQLQEAHNQSVNEEGNIIKSEDNYDLQTVQHNYQNMFVELSELLEGKQVEIEELKSRLFLATDQLIHFRTFFADPDYKRNHDREIIQTWKPSNTSVIDNSKKLQTKILLESEDDGQFSDSDDQSIVSPGGSTVIRVERIAALQTDRSNNILNRVFGRMKHNQILKNLKYLISSSGRHICTLRSQPRLNIRTLLALYLCLIHLILFLCIFF